MTIRSLRRKAGPPPAAWTPLCATTCHPDSSSSQRHLCSSTRPSSVRPAPLAHHVHWSGGEQIAWRVGSSSDRCGVGVTSSSSSSPPQASSRSLPLWMAAASACRSGAAMPAATSACAIASSLETPRCVASKRRAWAHVQRALRAPRQQRVSAWLVPSIRPWPDTQQPAVAAHGGAFLSILCSSSRYRFAAAGVESEGTAEADGGCWGDALGGDLYGTAMVGLSGRLPHPKLAALGVRWHLFVNAGSLVERYRPKNVAGRYIVRCVGVLAVCRFCDRAAHFLGDEAGSC